MAEDEKHGRAVGFASGSEQKPERGSQISRSHVEGEWERTDRPTGGNDRKARANETFESVSETARPEQGAEADRMEQADRARKGLDAETLAEELREAEEQAAGSRRSKAREKGAPPLGESNGGGKLKGELKEKMANGLQGVLSMPFVAGMGILKAFAQAIRRLSDRLMGTSWENRARAAKENLAETREQNNAMQASHEKLMKEDQEQMARMAYEGEELLSSIQKSKEGLAGRHAEVNAGVKGDEPEQVKPSSSAGTEADGGKGEPASEKYAQTPEERISGYLGGFSGAESVGMSGERSDAQQHFARKFDRHMRTPFPIGGLIFSNDRDFWDESRWQTEEVGIASTIEQITDPNSDTRGKLADVLADGDREDVAASLFELASYQNSIGKDEPSGTAAYKFAAAWYLARELAESLPPDVMQRMSQEVAEDDVGPSSTFVTVFQGYAAKLEDIQEFIQNSPELAALSAAWHDQSKALGRNGPMHETSHDEPVNSSRGAAHDTASVAPEHHAPANLDAEDTSLDPGRNVEPSGTEQTRHADNAPSQDDGSPSASSPDETTRGIGWGSGAAPAP